MILEAINRGRCILLVGSDVVFDDKEHSSVSLTRRLAQKLTKSLPNRASAMPDDLAHVAQLRKNAKGRFDLEFEVEEFYASQQGPTFEFHRYLAGLPFTLCLTTTPDDFMTQAFCEIGKRPIKKFYHFRKHRETNLSVPTREHPIVYSLFGHLSELDSLVLTETDLLDYLVNVVKGTPSLPPFIAGQLADRQTSFLFLGFGFQQWYLRVFLHALREVSVDWNPSLAIEASSFLHIPTVNGPPCFMETRIRSNFAISRGVSSRQNCVAAIASASGNRCRWYFLPKRLRFSFAMTAKTAIRWKKSQNSSMIWVSIPGETNRICVAGITGIVALSK